MAGAKPRKGGSKADAGSASLQVRVRPFGPTPEAMRGVGQRVLASAAMKNFLVGARARLLSVEAVDQDDEAARARKTPSPPTQYRVTVYDYTNDRTIIAQGPIDRPAQAKISEHNVQPPPTAEEFAEAVSLLGKHDPALGRLVAEGQLTPYAPMPPLIREEMPDGRIHRIINVGLLPNRPGPRHEIVGVNMSEPGLHRFPSRAPVGARATDDALCGAPVDASQPTVDRGTAGQAWVTVTQNGTTLWKFLVVRPAASSGTNGSGIELRFVDYRGKRLLHRAHVPILNVKYDEDACGPYRDWQWQEGQIVADGVDVAPGFRLCSTPAQTIFDTGSDSGNYLGTAIYVEGLEVVLVSEMQAGWYRYVSQWRLHADGAIRPRFAFAAVSSSCVCHIHHHHCYWRFDFASRPSGSRVREYNERPIVPGGAWHELRFEAKRARDPARKRKWRIEHTGSRTAYELIPGPNDGVASESSDRPFPKGDVWILRYHANELDDGVASVGPPYEADIDRWVSGESIAGHNIVIWYATHFTHDLTHDDPATHGHIVGPELKPVKW
jgi:hypothetical protein